MTFYTQFLVVLIIATMNLGLVMGAVSTCMDSKYPILTVPLQCAKVVLIDVAVIYAVLQGYSILGP